jgi:hypothetical protein
MTALDPSPVLSTRRPALDQLDELRELVARFLDRPSAEGLRELTSRAKSFLRFEADEVVPEVAASGFPEERAMAVLDGHAALAARLNKLSWAVPGSSDVQVEVHGLRHDLLAQITLYNELRLPRGALIPGT